MQPSPRPSRLTTLLALLAAATLLGGLAGAGDALATALRGHTSRNLFGLVPDAASFGAAVGLLGAAPLALLLALTARPRSAGRAIGLITAFLATAPATLALARDLHKRIPWGAQDIGPAFGGAVALVLLVVVAGETVRFALGGRGPRLLARLARWSPLVALLLVPAAIRAAAAWQGPDGGRGAGEGPNLLLLSVDTLRADRIGAGGDPDARTPWIDRLARTGTQRSLCVTPSPWTLPSLASMLTGAYPGEHRVLEELSGLSDAVTSLAECAKDSGLRTAAFVSNPWLATGSLARGFDVFDVAERPELLDPVRGTNLALALSKASLRLVKPDDAARLTRRSLAWLRAGEGRFFLWVHYFDPHLPNWPPVPFDRLARGRPPRLVGSSLTVEEIRAGEFPGGAEGRAEIHALYVGEVAYTDRAIGRLLRGLDADGALERTAIMFTADHGEEFWEHEGYGHGHAMFDEVIRVPLLVRPAGGAPGRLDGGLARLVDVAPTALALAGVECDEPPATRGHDLLGDASVPSTYGEAVLYGPEQKYLRTPRWKLVLEPAADSSAALRLFDLAFDPQELLDVSDAVPAEVDTLFAAISEWRRLVGSDGVGSSDLGANVDPAIREQLQALGYLP